MKIRSAVVVCLTLVAALAAFACKDGEEHTTILPTVQVDASADVFVTCSDFCGARPDDVVQRARAERNPKYCFVADQCFYDCPPRRCS